MKWLRSILLLSASIGMLSLATMVRADEGEGGEVCCTDGSPCQPGEACCRLKPPAAPCSSDKPMQCESDVSKCEGGSVEE